MTKPTSDLPDTGDANVHLFQVGSTPHVMLTNGSRVYGIDSELERDLRSAQLLGGSDAVENVLRASGLGASPYETNDPPVAPPLRALSLAIAQTCNLACSYCYASQGGFGGAAKSMDEETAFRAVDRLFEDSARGERVTLSFLGGEPLVNRRLLRATTTRATAIASKLDVPIQFAITTNGTLLTEEDGAFFEEHGFAVTVSLDGSEDVHNALRPFKNGRDSYAAVVARVQPLLQRQRRMQVSARVTVTPRNLQLRTTLDSLISMGFHSVGFSPMLSSPDGREQLNEPDLEHMLRQMIACGEQFEQRLAVGERYPFANLVNALREIHRGTHRPYPCGGGAGYMGVSADGDLSVCHRFVGEAKGALGSVAAGVDRRRQTIWLSARHVDNQDPCQACWARYLCGGGCHHEVLQRGRPACDYVRGWLHYCLQAYVRTLNVSPAWYGSAQ
jgi:uncharacterized protein